MDRALIVFLTAVLVAVGGVAVADPIVDHPPPGNTLARALGPRWEITSPTGALEAHRRPGTKAAPDFAERLDGAARSLRQRDRGITVELSPKGAVHLAGSSIDCDDVLMAAQQFAAIRGVNALVIDTGCRPRD